MLTSNATSRASVVALAALLLCHSPAFAQVDRQDEFHRVLRHVDLVAVATPRGAGRDLLGNPDEDYLVFIVWDVLAIRPMTATDMSADVVLSVNGVEVASQNVPVPLGPNDPKGGFVTCGDFPPTEDNPCHGSCPPCGEGIIGVCGVKYVPPPHNPPQPPPDCGPSDCDDPCPDGGDTGGLVPRAIQCVCTFEISTPFPPQTLALGDEVTVEVRAATGALAEIVTNDDILTFQVATSLGGTRVQRLVESGCSPSCPADIAPVGGDGVVNVVDFLALIATWGTCP
jgi:hypothetical protein